MTGEEKMQEKRRKRAAKLKNPTPVELPSGNWRCQVTVNGRRESVVNEDPEVAHAEALALKAELIKKKDRKKAITLNDAIQEYIAIRENVLSPSTIRGYELIRKLRFKGLMKRNIYTIEKKDMQQAINEEAKKLSAKTISNAYGLVFSVLMDHGIDVSGARLPQKIKKQKAYLEAEEIAKLIDAAQGDTCEIPIIMAVWLGMRRSEIAGLCWDCVDLEHHQIHVRRTVVMDKDNRWVMKDGAKNEGSQRTINCPSYIMDKLKAIYCGQEGRIFNVTPTNILDHVHAACKRAGITDTTVHGLRHTNATVMRALDITDGYAMARGGWTTEYTFKQIYSYVFRADAKRADETIDTFFESMISGDKLHTDLHTDKSCS